jgi:hypothetical protein
MHTQVKEMLTGLQMKRNYLAESLAVVREQKFEIQARIQELELEVATSGKDEEEAVVARCVCV